MFLIVLSVVLALVVAGCVCVAWAARGGPRWTHGVAKATLAAGELARGASKSSRKGKNSADTTVLGGDS